MTDCKHDNGIEHMGEITGEPFPGYRAAATFAHCMACDSVITGTWIFGANGVMRTGFNELELERRAEFK